MSELLHTIINVDGEQVLMIRGLHIDMSRVTGFEYRSQPCRVVSTSWCGGKWEINLTTEEKKYAND
jgi:hypothetical protein